MSDSLALRRLAALDVPRVARSGDDVVKDDVFGQQVEEVSAIGESVEPLFDDPKPVVKPSSYRESGLRRTHEMIDCRFEKHER